MNTKHLHGDRRHRKEINRHQLADVVVKKSLPRLSGRPGNASQSSRDSAFGDGDAEHLQFAMNPRRTPQGIGNNHPLNQSANPDGGSGPASPTAVTFVAAIGCCCF
jgi:hypothetical protein